MTSTLEKLYVCDMGIAKVKKAAEATVTSVNKGPGTFPYMAPEMFKSSPQGPAVDIYSPGCLFIELFGRRRVWPDLKCLIPHTSVIHLVDFVLSFARLMQTSVQIYKKFYKWLKIYVQHIVLVHILLSEDDAI